MDLLLTFSIIVMLALGAYFGDGGMLAVAVALQFLLLTYSTLNARLKDAERRIRELEVEREKSRPDS